MGREPKARNLNKRGAEGEAEIPPPDVEDWESRMGKTRGFRLVSDADFFVILQVKRGFQTMKKKIVFWAIVNI